MPTKSVKPKELVEYLVVGDTTSEVILSTSDWGEAKRTATMCRRAGGSVTIFKSTKG